ncbi:MAG: hypothetical protein ACTTHI_00410 [Prevotella sp.]
MFNIYALARPSLHCPVTKALRKSNKDERSGHEKASEHPSFYLEETFTGNPILFEKTILFDLFC